jgi:isopentenyldiphosphate isomerase
MNEDELLDLVDNNDQVIGQIWRSATARLSDSGEGYIRAATCLIQNPKGELWIPRRTKDQKIAPLGLDSSMQEHIGSGETYEQAALRGMNEELNLSLDQDDLEFIGKLSPTPDLYYFVALFRYKTDISPEYNPKDFVGAEWIMPEQLIKRLEAGEAAKSSLLPTVKLLIESR